MSEVAMTHDYRTREWGHDFSVLAVSGHTIRISGWGAGIRPGDHLILPNGHQSTRYRVTAIEYKTDPPDMWFADATFDPR